MLEKEEGIKVVEEEGRGEVVKGERGSKVMKKEDSKGDCSNRREPYPWGLLLRTILLLGNPFYSVNN